MTQPPQPPNEPPKGGFGAPQNPPPGGFGAPQNPPPGGFGAPTPPPAQPPGTPPPPPAGGPGGYGYPQAPGTPPPAAPGTPPPGQPGYGYPGQPGQPGQPPTAPQFGAYQQQPYGAPPPPPGGGGKKFNSQLAIIVAAVVAVALIVGGGVWFANSSSDDKKNEAKNSEGKGGSGGQEQPGGGGKEKAPSDPSSQVLFQVPAPKMKGENRTLTVAGSWLTDDMYAKSGDRQVVGYDPDSGKEQWTLPVSGPICAGSRTVSEDGIAAVVFEGEGTKAYNGCTEVVAFDTKTGDKLWQKNVKDGGDKADFQEVTLSANTVAVGGGTDGGAAFDLKSGKERWVPKPTDTCKDAGYAGGEALVAIRKCGSYQDPRLEVQLLDPDTGNPKWTYKLPNGIDNAKVISTKPVVFGVDSAEITASGATDIFALDDSGKLRSKIALEDGKYAHDCDVNQIESCSGITVGNEKVYVPTAEHQGGGEYGMTNEIISFDLDTGKTAGDKADAGDKWTMFPLRMDGSNIIAYKEPPYDKGGQIVSLDGKTMKETVLLDNPSEESVRDAETSFVLPDSAEMLYGNGKLFIADKLASKPSSSDTRPNLLFIAFGAK